MFILVPVHYCYLYWLVPHHSQYSTVHRPPVSMRLCLMLLLLSFFSCTWSSLFKFLFPDQSIFEVLLGHPFPLQPLDTERLQSKRVSVRDKNTALAVYEGIICCWQGAVGWPHRQWVDDVIDYCEASFQEMSSSARDITKWNEIGKEVSKLQQALSQGLMMMMVWKYPSRY